MGLVLLLLQEIFGETASDCATKRAEDAMALLAAKVVTCETAANCAKKTSVLLGHWRSIGVLSLLASACEWIPREYTYIVGRLGVCRLGRELVVCSLCLRRSTA